MNRTLIGLMLAVAFVPSVTSARAKPPPPVIVHISHYQFSPAMIQVKVAQQIIWKNDENPSAPVPLKKEHNLITEVDLSGRQALPVGSTRRVCPKFGPGKSCAPSTTDLRRLFPPGWHSLTCTIDREHTLAMHFLIHVVG